MFSQRSISRFSVRAGLPNQASRILGSRSESLPQSLSQISHNYNVFSGSRNSKDQAHMLADAGPKLFGSLGTKLGVLKVNANASPPSALNFRNGIHSACPKEFEMGRDSRSMDFVREVMEENRSNIRGGSQFPQLRGPQFPQPRGPQFPQQSNIGGGPQFPQQSNIGGGPQFPQQSNIGGGPQFPQPRGPQFPQQSNIGGGPQFPQQSNIGGGPQYPQHEFERDTADIVHIKMIRNNAFVTVTDAKGNKKIGASSGCLPGKATTRYSAESTAEHVGRLAKNMGLKSFVVKVNGFTYFKKKKQAILSFRDGYTNSRNDQNPIVYIEDTTRRAHNGCRLRKKRRV